MINKSGILNGAKYFPLDELQNYLVFQLFISDFKTKNHKIGSWISKEMSEESITPPSTTDNVYILKYYLMLNMIKNLREYV